MLLLLFNTGINSTLVHRMHERKRPVLMLLLSLAAQLYMFGGTEGSSVVGFTPAVVHPRSYYTRYLAINKGRLDYSQQQKNFPKLYQYDTDIANCTYQGYHPRDLKYELVPESGETFNFCATCCLSAGKRNRAGLLPVRRRKTASDL